MLDMGRIVNVYLAIGDIDMRKSINGLAALVQYSYGLDLIMVRLTCTVETEASLNVLAMNIAHAPRVFLRYISRSLFRFERAFLTI